MDVGREAVCPIGRFRTLHEGGWRRIKAKGCCLPGVVHGCGQEAFITLWILTIVYTSTSPSSGPSHGLCCTGPQKYANQQSLNSVNLPTIRSQERSGFDCRPRTHEDWVSNVAQLPVGAVSMTPLRSVS